jgi:hypothetical protein
MLASAKVGLMETFIAVLTHDADRASRALERAHRALERLFTQVYGSCRFTFERHQHGLLSGLSVRHASESMTSAVHVSSAPVVYVFGDSPTAVAKDIAESGVEHARATDNTFGAAVFEADAGTLLAAGDVTGQRALRFAHDDGLCVVSPHDIAVLATGVVPFELDTASAASALAVGWSVQGIPLARGLNRVDPMQEVSLSTNDASSRPASPLGLRPAPPKALCDAVVDAQLAYLDDALPKSGPITVELSAGLDSRGSFAAALAVRSKDQLRVFSDGGAESLDVRVAREIARRAGVSFDNPTPVRPSLDAVRRELGHFALATNGTGEALAIMTNRATDFEHDPKASVSGDGGEIFSGNYFPYRPFQRPSSVGLRPKEAFRSKFRLSNVRWAEPGLAQALERRLDAMFDGLASDAEDELDTLDRLYLLERYGVWNNKLKRCHGNSMRVSPYASVRGIRISYDHPAKKRACSPQAVLIRRHLSESLSLPINGIRRLDLDGFGELGRLSGDGYELGAKVLRKVRHKLERKIPFLRGQEGESLQGVRARILLELLGSGLEETLRAPSSPVVSVLGEPALDRALAELRGGDDSGANMIAMALMMNIYATLCADAAA